MKSQNLGTLVSFMIILTACNNAKDTFHTDKEILSIEVNGALKTSNWKIAPERKPDVFELECTQENNMVIFSDSINSISYKVGLNDTIDFSIVLNNKDTALTRIIGVRPNVNFTDTYIKKNRGKVNVAIPEVSELVNIVMVLHKDAEKDKNMFNTHTDYYKRVKSYFGPHREHRIIDTIQKYIHSLQYNESLKDSIFSYDSYTYYFALKMNACSYYFDTDGVILNDGVIREMAKGWNPFDPMKDANLMADFAKQSDFRSFYEQNKPYYDSLVATYKQLNPIDQMQQWLDKKFGFSYGNYTIYFSPLIYGAHSTQHFSNNGFNQTFMFICPAEYDPEYSKVMNALLESRVVFTEIDHNYVNPISDKYSKKINEVFSDREKWTKGEITDAYDNAYMVFNEYMTYAVYSLYLIDEYPEEEVAEFLPKMESQMENRRGFIKFGAFNRELIRKYKEDNNCPMDKLYMHILEWATQMD